MRELGAMGFARTLLALTLLGSVGCAFEPGEPFGLVTASLDAHYEPLAARDLGGGFQRLASDYEVRLTSASLTVDAVELLSAEIEGTIASFDPAHPPAGYSSCHGGHCHAADGSLVSYEDIAAELSHSGGASLAAVASLSSPPVSLLDATPTGLTCAPSCTLPRGHLALARLTAHELVLAGEVRDGRPEPRIDGTRSWRAELPLHEHDHADSDDEDDHEGEPAEPHGVFEVAMNLVIDEDEPSRITMSFALLPSSTLLDDVDFSALPVNAEGVLELTHPTAAEAMELLLHRFDALHLHVDISREDG